MTHAECVELERAYQDAASPNERVALLQKFCEVNPRSLDRKTFAAVLAVECGGFTERQIENLEHFRKA